MCTASISCGRGTDPDSRLRVRSSSRVIDASLAADALYSSSGWNGYMDDFSTWVLLVAPVTGLVVVVLTALAALV